MRPYLISIPKRIQLFLLLDEQTILIKAPHDDLFLALIHISLRLQIPEQPPH